MSSNVIRGQLELSSLPAPRRPIDGLVDRVEAATEFGRRVNELEFWLELDWLLRLPEQQVQHIRGLWGGVRSLAEGLSKAVAKEVEAAFCVFKTARSRQQFGPQLDLIPASIFASDPAAYIQAALASLPDCLRIAPAAFSGVPRWLKTWAEFGCWLDQALRPPQPSRRIGYTSPTHGRTVLILDFHPVTPDWWLALESKGRLLGLPEDWFQDLGGDEINECTLEKIVARAIEHQPSKTEPKDQARHEVSAADPPPNPQDEPPQRWLSFREVASHWMPRRGQRTLDVSTLYRWRKRGIKGVRLEAKKVGGSWCTTEVALNRFIERTTAAANGEASPAQANVDESAYQRADQSLADSGW